MRATASAPRRRLLLRAGVLALALVAPAVAVQSASPPPADAASSKSSVSRTVSRMRTVVPGGKVILSSDFTGQALGRVKPAAFRATVGRTNSNPAEYEDMTFVRSGSGAGRALRTRLERGTIRQTPAGNNGAVLVVKLPKAYDRACVGYNVRFDKSFDWSLGGKLPGLLGVAPGVSPSTPTGGGPTDRGWSARAMWLGPKAYRWAGPENMGLTYLYHPGQSATWGDNVRWNTSFVAGRWHSVVQCHVMNRLGRTDGKLSVWLDGTLVRRDEAVVYRRRGDVHVTHLDWSIFRGGDSLRWAGRTTGYVDVDDVVVLGS